MDATLSRHVYDAASARLPQLCSFNSWENQRSGLGQSAQYPGLIRQLPATTGESVVLCLARTRSHGCCCNNSVFLLANKAIHKRRNRSLNEIPSGESALQAAEGNFTRKSIGTYICMYVDACVSDIASVLPMIDIDIETLPIMHVRCSIFHGDTCRC